MTESTLNSPAPSVPAAPAPILPPVNATKPPFDIVGLLKQHERDTVEPRDGIEVVPELNLLQGRRELRERAR